MSLVPTYPLMSPIPISATTLHTRASRYQSKKPELS
jgi:hypothetical protein